MQYERKENFLHSMIRNRNRNSCESVKKITKLLFAHKRRWLCMSTKMCCVVYKYKIHLRIFVYMLNKSTDFPSLAQSTYCKSLCESPCAPVFLFIPIFRHYRSIPIYSSIIINHYRSCGSINFQRQTKMAKIWCDYNECQYSYT